MASKQKVSDGADEIERLRTQLQRLDADHFSTRTQSMQEILGRQNRVSALERQLQSLKLEWDTVTEVTSEFDGRAMELKTEPGNLVAPGGTVLTLEGGIQQLEAVFFVPAAVGKQIQQGMAVEVSPSTVRREEFGFLKASVSYVSGFPVTPDAIMRRFGNELMLQSLTASGPLTEVRAALQTDSKMPEGYRWSFSRAPAIALTSGTMCTADVVIREQHPVQLVIPAIRRAL
jgi:HlyD family secretion protein